MWVGVMTFQYSHRLLRPHWCGNGLRTAAIPLVSTRGVRAQPIAAGLSRPFGSVRETGAVSSRSRADASSGTIIGILADGPESGGCRAAAGALILWRE